MALAMAAVEIEDLVVRFADKSAVDGVSLRAEAGQVLAVLGPNGAGKTTTIETAEGYRRPDRGAVRVLGLDPVRDRPRLASRVGAMLQEGGVYPAMATADAVRLFASYYADPVDPESLIESLGLSGAAKTPWRRLSGGEQQRLSLALALVGRPEVAFLDEPTAGVDPQGRIAIRQVIAELRDSGVCIVLTTHELDEAQKLADHIVIIDRGRVVADGTPAQIMGSIASADIRFGTTPGIDTASLGRELDADVVEESPGEYRVARPGDPATVAALTAWLARHDLPLADMRAGRQRLEDVFLQLVASSEEPSAPAAGPGRRRRGRRP